MFDKEHQMQILEEIIKQERPELSSCRLLAGGESEEGGCRRRYHLNVCHYLFSCPHGDFFLVDRRRYEYYEKEYDDCYETSVQGLSPLDARKKYLVLRDKYQPFE